MYTFMEWFKVACLLVVAGVYLADVSFPRDVAVWNLACLCIVLF